MDSELTPEAIVLLNNIANQMSNGQVSSAYSTLNQQIVGSGQQFANQVNNSADRTVGAMAQFRGAANAALATVNRAADVASNTQGDLRTTARTFGGQFAEMAIKPFAVAEDNFRTMQAISTAGTMFDSLGEQLMTGAQLNLSQAEIAAFGQQVEELRASGLLSAQALQQLVDIRNAFEQADTTEGLTLGLEGAKALGIELNRLAALQLQFQDLYGPSMQGQFNEFAEALDSNIQYQNMLAQTTGMSVEAQIAATNQLMKTPGALARQMDLITNPTATRNLVRFANTVAAIGASDLAEGFISGVGIPTPGNEIEAALKPQTTALLAMRANMEAQGASQAEIRRMDERIAETYARESQGVMQQLGRFAPFLGSEFAFLQRDVNQQRATMLGQAVNPNFVSDQRVDALNAITARLDDEVITRLAGIQVDFANTAEALRLTAAAGINSEAFEAAAGAMENLTNVVDGLSTGLSNIAIGQANIDTLTAVVTGTVEMIQQGKDVAELSPAQEQRFLELAPQMLEGIKNNALETMALDPAFEEFASLTDLLDTAKQAVIESQPPNQGPPVLDPEETSLRDTIFQEIRDGLFNFIGLQRETNTKLDQLTGATVTSGAQQARATEQVGVTGQMAGVNGGN